MAVYIIGDVQGCFDELQELLQLISYEKEKDELWFTGDLVNRGPKSLEVLRFVMELPHAITVLGNHDLSLLALAYAGISLSHHTLQDILHAADKEFLLSFLRNRPLVHFDEKRNTLLVHAGIPPQWNTIQTLQYANEVEGLLRSDAYLELLKNMFGNTPQYWHEELRGWERSRFIINALTRLRFCDLEGRINLEFKGPLGSQPKHLLPWFKVPHRQTKDTQIVFGHWAALRGQCDEPNVISLDTGCVWGYELTAMRLEDNKFYSVACRQNYKNNPIFYRE